MELLEIFAQLENTSSTKEKEQIMRSVIGTKEEHIFKEICYLTYSSDIDFYIKDFIKCPKNEHWESTLLYQALCDLRSVIVSRSITGNLAKRWIEEQYQTLTYEYATIFDRIIKRDLRCGISAKTINKVWPSLIYIHPYMRCSSFNEKNLSNIKFPCFSQTKMDGLYCDIIVYQDRVEYRSRNGSLLSFNSNESDSRLILNCYGSVLMGEAIAVDESGNLMERSLSNGYLNSDNIDPNRIKFFLWDCVPYEDFLMKIDNCQYKTRFSELTKMSKRFLSNFTLVDSRMCNNIEEIVEHFRIERETGNEGTVIKNQSGIWKNGTSKDQVKIKVVAEVEMVATGFKEGTGRNEGKLGAIEFSSADGKIVVSVGTGYKDNERKDWFLKAQEFVDNKTVATIRANDVLTTENGMSLFLPRFVEFRTDKSEADSSDMIVEQFKSFVNALKMIKS